MGKDTRITFDELVVGCIHMFIRINSVLESAELTTRDETVEALRHGLTSVPPEQAGFLKLLTDSLDTVRMGTEPARAGLTIIDGGKLDP